MCCKDLAHAAAGIALAILMPADSESVKARRDQCRECPEATRNQNRLDRPTKGLTSRSRCKLCKCFISLKTKSPGETCPLGKWGKA